MIAEGVLDIVESQDAIGRVVATLVDEVNRHATAGAAAVFEDSVREGSDLRQGESCALGKEAWWVVFLESVTDSACEGASNGRIYCVAIYGSGLRRRNCSKRGVCMYLQIPPAPTLRSPLRLNDPVTPS